MMFCSAMKAAGEAPFGRWSDGDRRAVQALGRRNRWHRLPGAGVKPADAEAAEALEPAEAFEVENVISVRRPGPVWAVLLGDHGPTSVVPTVRLVFMIGNSPVDLRLRFQRRALAAGISSIWSSDFLEPVILGPARWTVGRTTPSFVRRLVQHWRQVEGAWPSNGPTGPGTFQELRFWPTIFLDGLEAHLGPLYSLPAIFLLGDEET